MNFCRLFNGPLVNNQVRLSLMLGFLSINALMIGNCGLDEDDVRERGTLSYYADDLDADGCNQAQLNNCLRYQGGDACYKKWNCSKDAGDASNNTSLCQVDKLKICLKYAGGNACYDKFKCEPGDENKAVPDNNDGATGASGCKGGAYAVYNGVNTNTCALLSVIGWAEGTNNQYNIIYSFKTFSSYADHPRRVICAGGYCSSAAGRYQFLDTTWDMTRKALGLSDFKPANQDRGAIYLIENRGVRNHTSISTYADLQKAIYKIAYEWASLPGSPYGQPTRTMNQTWSKYSQFLGS